jgi:hypothetical protein
LSDSFAREYKELLVLRQVTPRLFFDGRLEFCVAVGLEFCVVVGLEFCVAVDHLYPVV